MTFVVDAQLPPALARVLRGSGCDALPPPRMYVNPGVLDGFRRSVPAMRLLLLGIAAFFFIPNLHADEQLLVMTVYAHIVLANQVAPAPDPFLEAAVRGEIPAVGEGMQELQAKSFQINSKFQDFAPVVAGVEGQSVSIQFTAAVLRNGICAVTQYRAMAFATTSKGQTSPIGSSQAVSPGGFRVTPGSRVVQSVSAQSGGATVVYYLIFSAAKGIGQ